MLEELSVELGQRVTLVLEVTIGESKFSSIEMWAVWCCGDGFGPLHELRNESELNVTEYVSPAAGSPRFRDQCAVSETGFVGAEVIEDFVNDLDGYVDRVSIALAGGEL